MFVFFEKQAGLKNGFSHLYSKFQPYMNQKNPTNKDSNIYQLMTLGELTKYLTYLMSPSAKDEFYSKGNFEYLGPTSFRLLRTKQKDCVVPEVEK